MKRNKIRHLRKISLKKENYLEAELYIHNQGYYYDNSIKLRKRLSKIIKDRKSQRRLLPIHLRLKKIPRFIEIKI
ncbi:MAG: hypothetical protein ACTSPY_14970 [Candidatus Helarchaeota archaeon]